MKNILDISRRDEVRKKKKKTTKKKILSSYPLFELHTIKRKFLIFIGFRKVFLL